MRRVAAICSVPWPLTLPQSVAIQLSCTVAAICLSRNPALITSRLAIDLWKFHVLELLPLARFLSRTCVSPSLLGEIQRVFTSEINGEFQSSQCAS